MSPAEQKQLVGDTAATTPSEGEGQPGRKGLLHHFLVHNILVLTTLAGVVVGIGLGLGLRETKPSSDALMWLGLPGELFLRCLKLCIVPLVICLVITSTASLDARSSGKLALVCAVSSYLTQLVAVTEAVIFFFVFKPESGTLPQEHQAFGTDIQTQDIFADLLRNIFSDNFVGTTISQTKTKYNRVTYVEKVPDENGTLVNRTLVTSVRDGTEKTDGINILGIILVCTALGLAASRTVSRDGIFLRFFLEAQEVILVVVRWLFWT